MATMNNDLIRRGDVLDLLARGGLHTINDRLDAVRAIPPNTDVKALLQRWQSEGCPDCSGDCGSANPPVSMCIMQETRDVLRMLGK